MSANHHLVRTGAHRFPLYRLPSVARAWVSAFLGPRPLATTGADPGPDAGKRWTRNHATFPNVAVAVAAASLAGFGEDTSTRPPPEVRAALARIRHELVAAHAAGVRGCHRPTR